MSLTKLIVKIGQKHAIVMMLLLQRANKKKTSYIWTRQQTSNTIKNGPLEIYEEKVKLSSRNDLLRENSKYKKAE